MRTLRCLETLGSDQPLTQCRIPREMYLELHRCEKPRTRILEIRQSFTGMHYGLYCVKREKDTRISGLNISKTRWGRSYTIYFYALFPKL
jgi:hypothetical protein